MKTIKLISFQPDVKTQAARLKQPGVNVDCTPPPIARVNDGGVTERFA